MRDDRVIVQITFIKEHVDRWEASHLETVRIEERLRNDILRMLREENTNVFPASISIKRI